MKFADRPEFQILIGHAPSCPSFQFELTITTTVFVVDAVIEMLYLCMIDMESSAREKLALLS